MTSSNAAGIRPLTAIPAPPEPRAPSPAELTVLYTRHASMVADLTGRLVGVLIEDAACDLADDLAQEVWLRAAAGAIDPDTAAADLTDLVRLVVAQHDAETRTRPIPSGLLAPTPLLREDDVKSSAAAIHET